MSGVFGIFRFDGAEVSRSDLERQQRALAHLGPDGVATHIDGPIGLGALLLRINQEDSHDRQPLYDDETGSAFVCDARIDNREEIATALGIAGEVASAMADSDLAFAAIKAWGPDGVDRLLGDFVLAFWDASKQTLTLARDHMGQRNIFYHLGAGFLAFASEIKGLWALPEAPRALREAGFIRRLLMQPASGSGETEFEGVKALLGGSILTIDASGAVTTRRYWEPHADPAHVGKGEAYYVEAYRRVLGEAVACRLRRAIAPAGLFMSGGFDTGAICALAGPVLQPSGGKLITVSSVMPEDYVGTIKQVRPWVEVCRRHMPHLDVRYVTSEGLDILDGMERTFLTNDGFHTDYRSIVDAMLKVIAAGGGRVVMDGFGGDYTLNPRGTDGLVRLLRRGHLLTFAKEFAATRRHLGRSWRQTLVRNVLLPGFRAKGYARWRRWRSGLSAFGHTTPVSDDVLETARRDRIAPRAAQGARAGESLPVRKLRLLKRMQNQSRAGYSIPAAAAGLKFTAAFHDKRVVELGLAIPELFEFKNGHTRHLARLALADLYPPEFQERRPGNEDIAPDILALATRAKPRMLAEIERMETSGRLAAYFDFPRMRQMLTQRGDDQHASGDEYDTRQAVNAFIAARWLEYFRGDNQ